MSDIFDGNEYINDKKFIEMMKDPEIRKKILNMHWEHIPNSNEVSIIPNSSEVNQHGPDISEIMPSPNNFPAIWDLVIQDMKKRDAMGNEKYGTRLRAFNGRNVLWDAYQEALDLVVYLRQAIYEKENK